MQDTQRTAARPVRGRLAYLWTMVVVAFAAQAVLQLASPLAHWLRAALP
jgi:hypothetical protein